MKKIMTREEALETVRKNMPTDRSLPVYEALQTLIPELRESEDERITRAINNMLPFIPDEAYANNGVTKEGVLNWLKKQKEHNLIMANSPQLGEQKPAEWSEEDEAMRDNILRLLSCFVGSVECDSNPSLSTSYPAYMREMDWLKSLRPQPKQGWSEEDENRLNAVMELLENTSAIHPNYSHRKLIIWLKSLRPSWKPYDQLKNL